jgi:predicted O-linked N-acetylglucosamine transferase (SPINDLY family)
VDLAGHTPGHRLGAFALRPAPVCVTWLDYFDTTGLDAMDAIITDPWHSPVEDVQRFTEAVIRLPRLRLCWEPPAGAPVVRPPPCTGGGGFVFGSFNRFAKHSPSTLDAWCRVLHAVPSSRFLLKSGSLDHPEEHAHARRRFAERGIDPNRIECRGQSPHERMLREYGDIDLALDSFPYNGGVVTCEALWMGRPVLALRGDSMISRQSAAILACVGAEEWIARDVDDFVEIAVRAAADPEGHARACLGLRERVAASPLVDAASFARDFEAALQEAWIRFAGA